MIALGWALVALPVVLVVYAYFLYPALLWLITGRGSKSSTPARHGSDAGEPPMVSIVVPAYNEERQIRGKIEALLRQPYPANRRQILVLSDASTDGTDDVVREYAHRGVELMRMPRRMGKTAAENAACSRLLGEIVINSDASIRLRHGAIPLLVAAMADPSVGVASTRDASVAADELEANEAEAGYVGYEMRIRQLETLAGGIIGASGSGYAIRRSIHDIPIPEMLSRDFSAALVARAHGLRAISVEGAVAAVPRAQSLRREYRRKVRTIHRGMDTLVYWRRMLDPMRYGAFAWKLWSHKVCRWLIPLSAVAAVIGFMILAPTVLMARLALIGVGVLAGMVTVAWNWPDQQPMPRLLSLVAFGTLANIAVVHAVGRLIVGQDDPMWEPTRRSASIQSA